VSTDVPIIKMGTSVDFMPSEIPLMMTVAGPVVAALATRWVWI